MHSTHVEITFVAHTFPGFKELTSSDSEINGVFDVKKYIEDRGGPIVVNYRFIRELTRGVKDSWTVNAVNHFHLSEDQFSNK